MLTMWPSDSTSRCLPNRSEDICLTHTDLYLNAHKNLIYNSPDVYQQMHEQTHHSKVPNEMHSAMKRTSYWYWFWMNPRNVTLSTKARQKMIFYDSIYTKLEKMQTSFIVTKNTLVVGKTGTRNNWLERGMFRSLYHLECSGDDTCVSICHNSSNGKFKMVHFYFT